MKISRWTKIKWKVEATFYLLVIKFVECVLKRLSKYESKKAEEKKWIVLTTLFLCWLVFAIWTVYWLLEAGWL